MISMCTVVEVSAADAWTWQSWYLLHWGLACFAICSGLVLIVLHVLLRGDAASVKMNRAVIDVASPTSGLLK